MKKEIPFGAFDSELMHQEISIPDGFEAVIEGDKIILKKIGSEDERIRDEIIDFLKLPHPQFVGKRDHEKWISWLEKQGEQSSLNINRECLKGIKRVQEYQDLSDWEKEFDKIASMYAHNKNQEGYNDSWYVKERAAEMLYYAKKELEKQGEKPKPSIRERYKRIANSEWFKKTHEGMSVSDDEKVDNVNKVESKFKVGDWVVSPNGVYWHIDAIQNGRYEVTSDTGQCGNWPLDTNIYRLWTIQDAKDGDVLCTPNGNTFIFKTIDGDKILDYCGLYFNKFFSDCGSPNGSSTHYDKCNYHPATKEQYDLLFQKMKESGYEWNSENKELKKISQRMISAEAKEAMYDKTASAWGEEDERILDALITSLNNEVFAGRLETLKGIGVSLVINWLKSLKGRVQPQYEWSEEEIEKAAQEWETKANFSPFYMTPTGVKQDITTHKKSFKAGINWFLKFLKGRVQPQNAWKPSDEQLNSLKQAINAFPYETDYLELLYDDLKKLKGE